MANNDISKNFYYREIASQARKYPELKDKVLELEQHFKNLEIIREKIKNYEEKISELNAGIYLRTSNLPGFIEEMTNFNGINKNQTIYNAIEVQANQPEYKSLTKELNDAKIELDGCVRVITNLIDYLKKRLSTIKKDGQNMKEPTIKKFKFFQGISILSGRNNLEPVCNKHPLYLEMIYDDVTEENYTRQLACVKCGHRIWLPNSDENVIDVPVIKVREINTAHELKLSLEDYHERLEKFITEQKDILSPEQIYIYFAELTNYSLHIDRLIKNTNSEVDKRGLKASLNTILQEVGSSISCEEEAKKFVKVNDNGSQKN